MQWIEESHCEYDRKSMETEATTWSEFHNRGKAIVGQMLVSEERNKSKREVTVWATSGKVNHLSKVAWDRKVITEFARSIRKSIDLHREFLDNYCDSRFLVAKKLVLMIDVKASKDKNISKWVDGGNLIYVKWNWIKNCEQRRRRWWTEVKEVRHWMK